jgi:hypothetical protein
MLLLSSIFSIMALIQTKLTRAGYPLYIVLLD